MTDYKEDVFNELSSYFEETPEHLNVFEEEIDINVQLEFYRYMKRISRDIDSKAALPQNAKALFSKDTPEEDKKKLLVLLANVNEVDAYRTIEKFVNSGDPELRPWGIIALQQSRMLLESSLLDEKSVFISTGLGGKGKKLRYFCVLFGKNITEFSTKQQDLLKKEVKFAFEDADAELETFESTGNIVCFKALIPIEANLKTIFDGIINEVNNYGNFLKDNMIVTNVKSLSINEINEILRSNFKKGINQ